MKRTIIRIIIIILLSLNIVYLFSRYRDSLTGLRFPLLEQIAQLVGYDMGPKSIGNKSLQTSTAKEFSDGLNDLRETLGLESLDTSEEELCQLAQALSEDPSTDVFSICKDCAKVATLRITNQASADRLLLEVETNADQENLIRSQGYTHSCSVDDIENQEIVSVFANYTAHQSVTLQANQTSSGLEVIPTSPPKNFTEQELWSALVEYRHAHQKPDIIFEPKLCEYARERVQEHIQKYATTAKEAYPRQDKYPLDAHQGFIEDGDSGYLFEKTGRNAVAENLAYWPTAQVPHHIIEWGWDTSTEGHRELQLTTDYSHACISGDSGFYVAIFAR